MEHNPWSQKTVDNFLFFCCPECDVKEKTSDEFLKHALVFHKDAKDLLSDKICVVYVDPITSVEEVQDNFKQVPKELRPPEIITDLKTEPEFRPPEITDLNIEPIIELPPPLSSVKTNDLKRSLIETDGIDSPEPKKRCLKLQCYFCSDMFDSEEKVQDHIKENHSSYVSEKMYGHRRMCQCLDCNRVFKSPESMQLHICGILPQSLLGPDQKSQKCPKCEKEFTKYGDLLCHYNLDHKDESDDQSYTCTHPVCKRLPKERNTFNSRFALSLHVSTRHRYFCKFCDKEYYSPRVLKMHMEACQFQDVPEDNPLECLYCGKVLLSPEELHKHMIAQHEGLRAYFEPGCKYYWCLYRAKSKKQLLEHCKNEHQLNCVICQEVFIVKADLIKHHKLKHDNEKTLLCDSCEFTCALLSDLAEHKKTVHDKIFAHVCGICGQGFQCSFKYRKHMEIMHIKAKAILCELCDFRCDLIGQLRQHKKRMHDKIREHMCEVCGKGFYEIRAWKDHMILKHSEPSDETFECDYCKITFKTNALLQAHKSKFHEKFNICTRCDKVFIGRKIIKDHLADEHLSFGAKSDVKLCAKCDQRFKKTSELDRHLFEEHSMTKEHVCTQCNDVFVSSTILTSHLMEVHAFDPTKEEGGLQNVEQEKIKKSTVKTFKCEYCGDYLKSKPSLTSHVKQLHLKEKHKFFCKECDYSTYAQAQLKAHIDYHHTERTFKCDQCDHKASTKSRLKSHVNRKHVRGYGHGPDTYCCPQCPEKFSLKHVLIKHCLNEHQLLIKDEK